MGKTFKLGILFLFHHVDDEGGEYEHQEPDVQSGDQLLKQNLKM